ncbi:hypothetical protein [Rhodococcus sp. Q]|uniref:hypothetical protein n=1 Tax=Rhodococcus sp. Q TaxID=2502252 RepID=UPI0010F6FC16|nr:hypothetical protein [Rhodococcus sp. Q]
MTWQGQLVTTPIGVALVTALWFVAGLPSVFLWALPIAAVAGLLFGVCALAGARVAIRLARATAPRPWQWRQMFAVCVGFSTLLLTLPAAAWIDLATVLAPCLIAAGGYLCALLICPPLERAITDVARPDAHGR